MHKINLIKRDPVRDGKLCLFPADLYAEQIIDSLKINTWYTAALKRPRNPKFHSLIMALATICVHHAPEDSPWHNVDPLQFVYAVMFDAGIVDLKMNLDGTIRKEAKHINFESMSEDEFEPVADLVFAHTARITGVEEQYLRDHYEEIFAEIPARKP